MLLCFTLAAVLGVIFANGFTDAPNAIGSAVACRAISLRQAAVIGVLFNFLGVAVMTLWCDRVAQTVFLMVDLTHTENALGVLGAGMMSVCVWAVAAWAFGIPTSESHALLAGLTGAALAAGGTASPAAWKKVLCGLLVCSAAAFFIAWGLGYTIRKLCRAKERVRTQRLFLRGEILSACANAFLHGAQDGQKFMGVMMLALFWAGKAAMRAQGAFDVPVLVVVVCAGVMGLGTLAGGKRIIKKVGFDMVLGLQAYQACAADAAAALCLLISSLSGLPVSTTNAKTTALMGACAQHRKRSVRWQVAGEMFLAWGITFPGCGALGYLFTKWLV